jgi:hypothetical protein
MRHTVTITPDGFVWQDRTYPSLSAVARAMERPPLLRPTDESRSGGGRPMTPHPPRRILRCAIYTRKSTEHNLDLEFNSLDAQREAGPISRVRLTRAGGWSGPAMTTAACPAPP